jgi:hypothetical protein
MKSVIDNFADAACPNRMVKGICCARDKSMKVFEANRSRPGIDLICPPVGECCCRSDFAGETNTFDEYVTIMRISQIVRVDSRFGTYSIASA